jgi:hypothetical protein
MSLGAAYVQHPPAQQGFVSFTTQFTCFASTRVQILTLKLAGCLCAARCVVAASSVIIRQRISLSYVSA